MLMNMHKGFILTIAHWVQSFSIKLTIALVLVVAILAIGSMSASRGGPNRKIGDWNAVNLNYAAMTLGISDLDTANSTVKLTYWYQYGPMTVTQSGKNGVDLSKNLAFFSAWSSATESLPAPSQPSGQSQSITVTNTPAFPTLNRGQQTSSSVKASGDSFWFPFDKYNFSVLATASIPNGINIGNTQYTRENITEMPFGFSVYSSLNGYIIKVQPEPNSNNELHITIDRPVIVVASRYAPVALLLWISLWSLTFLLKTPKSIKSNQNVLVLLLGVIPALMSIFQPTEIQESFLNYISYAAMAVCAASVLLVFLKSKS